MKLSEYLVFAVLLIPTVVVIAAALISLAKADPAPEYPTSIVTASSNGLYPSQLGTDE